MIDAIVAILRNSKSLAAVVGNFEKYKITINVAGKSVRIGIEIPSID